MTVRRLICAALAVGVGAAAASAQEGATYGAAPALPAPQATLLPTMHIPRPAGWGDDLPAVPPGYTIRPIATGLKIPRQMLVLPNGDILVAEGKGGGEAMLRPKDFIAGVIKGWGKSPEPGGNRLTLLRDADGDGSYETQGVFAEGLNAPYGLAYTDGAIYVANTDALLRFDYREGDLQAAGPPRTVTDLPSRINHHWTKSLAASADGRLLYVGIGSNSNITERGLDAEQDRALVWQIDPESGMHRPYATGIRNPTALALQPETGRLWAVANERDELGDDLVPDYLTSVEDGKFYGWPYSYYGQNVDDRVRPQDPAKVAAAVPPDYALGSHVAALGVAFSVPAMGAPFADGAFVGEHGSWNRSPPAGYKVVFVPFTDGKPSGDPVDFVTGFLVGEGRTRGRPVGVAVDPRGAVLIADDVANTIWRVTRDKPEGQAAAAPGQGEAVAQPAAAGPSVPPG